MASISSYYSYCLTADGLDGDASFLTGPIMSVKADWDTKIIVWKGCGASDTDYLFLGDTEGTVTGADWYVSDSSITSLSDEYYDSTTTSVSIAYNGSNVVTFDSVFVSENDLPTLQTQNIANNIYFIKSFNGRIFIDNGSETISCS